MEKVETDVYHAMLVASENAQHGAVGARAIDRQSDSRPYIETWTFRYLSASISFNSSI